MSLSLSHRLRLTACLDRLIYESQGTFRRSDAQELDRLMPRLPRWRAFLSQWLPHLSGQFHASDLPHSGSSPGIGNIEIRDGTISVEYDSLSNQNVRAGQWKLSRSGRDIDIEQMMSDDTDNGRKARLIFRGGHPARLLLHVQTHLVFGGLSFSIGALKPWKNPI
jgi:hypothetical protein